MSNGLLGRLGIELYADLSRFSGDLGRADKELRSFATGAAFNFDKIGTAITGIATTLGVISFGKLVGEVAAARAQLDDLADSGFGSVESLSQLKSAATLSGSSLEDLTGGLSKMVKGLAGSEKETSAAGEAFRRLGISVRDGSGAIKEPAELFKQLSVELGKYKDGADKAAFAQAILGKVGEKFLPLLKDMTEYGELQVKVTARQAAEADEFEKAQKRLSVALSGSKTIIAGEMIPAASGFIDALGKMINGSNDAGGSIKKLASDNTLSEWAKRGAFALGAVIDVGQTLGRTFEAASLLVSRSAESIGDNFSSLGKAAEKVQRGDFVGAFSELTGAYKRAKQEASATAQDIKSIFGRERFTDTLAQSFIDLDNKIKASLSDDKKKPTLNSKGLGQSTKEVNEFIKALEAANKSIAALDVEAQDPLGKSLQSMKKLAEIQASDVWQKFTGEQKKEIAALYEKGVALERSIIAYKEHVKANQEAIKATEEHEKAIKGLIAGLEDQNDKYKFETSILGLNNEERERALLLRAKEESLIGQTDAATIKAIETLYAEREALLQTRLEIEKQQEGFKSMFSAMDSAAQDAFTNIFEGGSNVFKRLTDSLKSTLLAALYQMTVRPFVINLAAKLTGTPSDMASTLAGGTGGGLGSLGNLLGGGNLLANGLNGIGGFASSLGFESVGNFIGGATGALQGPTLTGAALGGEAAAAGAGSLGSIVGTLGTAMPYIAAALAIAQALGAFERGGPKSGGDALFSVNKGKVSSQADLGDENKGGFFTPDNLNSQIQGQFKPFVDSLGGIVSKLGGSALSLNQIGVGFDTDPEGKAGNRFASRIVNQQGQTTFSRFTDVGRSEAELQKGLTDEFSRLTLAALQQADLSPWAQKFLSTIDPVTASIDEISAALQSVTVIADTVKFLDQDPLAEAAKQFEESQNTITSALERTGDALEKVIEAYDGSAESSSRLAQATSEYYLAQVSLLTQIEQIRMSIGDMFGNTIRQIELAGKDKQGQYDFFQKEADSLMDALLNSSSVEEIQKLSEKINADIGAAFGLLSPDEQMAKSGDFADRAKETQKLVDEKLKQVEQEAKDKAKDDLDRVRAILLEGGGTIQTAANTLNTASNTALVAANTPRQIIIRDDRSGGEVTMLEN